MVSPRACVHKWVRFWYVFSSKASAPKGLCAQVSQFCVRNWIIFVCASEPLTCHCIGMSCQCHLLYIDVFSIFSKKKSWFFLSLSFWCCMMSGVLCKFGVFVLGVLEWPCGQVAIVWCLFAGTDQWFASIPLANPCWMLNIETCSPLAWSHGEKSYLSETMLLLRVFSLKSSAIFLHINQTITAVPVATSCSSHAQQRLFHHSCFFFHPVSFFFILLSFLCLCSSSVFSSYFLRLQRWMKVVSNAPEQMKRACAAAMLGAVALSSVAGPKYPVVLIDQAESAGLQLLWS